MSKRFLYFQIVKSNEVIYQSTDFVVFLLVPPLAVRLVLVSCCVQHSPVDIFPRVPINIVLDNKFNFLIEFAFLCTGNICRSRRPCRRRR